MQLLLKKYLLDSGQSMLATVIKTRPVEPLFVRALSTATFFEDMILWLSGQNGHTPSPTSPIVTYRFERQFGDRHRDFGDLPGSVIVSANGHNTGIAPHAFDVELWNSGLVSGDNLESGVTFALPTVANGRVYIDTRNSLVVYGLI
ncbi:hypothetical protein LIPSTDRAFT_71133 [Lipomyces starkeyi NRRL Y-11557]|uniref:Uncharacterized protein n=1 Tax=Lipomyces starkeyi NRRL Y-11557 TaxID=675824 RepID=A0A1E3Q5H0_LIPST|nr:hypothetical protein LIPSTDRAFT_71133 [Lipomyces starkeyi NRRL Y-11557]